MSDKSTEQKYFIGNWVRHKQHHHWMTFILGVQKDDESGYIYDMAFADPWTYDNPPPYLSQSDLEQFYEIIPYPWQLFFKVGDKVKCGNQEGRIDRIFTGPRRKDFIEINCGDGVGFINCAPHELIKIGENNE